MKTLRYFLLGLALVGGLLAAPEMASAITTEEIFYQVVDIIHGAKPNTVPASGDIKPYITCLQGKDAFQCAETITTASGGDNTYLETIKKVIKIYIAVDAGDFWGVIGVAAEWLGDDAPCILADVLTGGVGGEVCSLVKELIATAEAVVEAAKEFVETVGEALSALADAASCVVSLGTDCGDEPEPPPADEVAYAKVYNPSVQSGLALSYRESWVETAFPDLRSSLSPQAHSYGAAAAYKAEQKWLGVTDSQWTSHVTKTVNNEVGKTRGDYEQGMAVTIEKIIVADGKGTPLPGTSCCTPSKRIEGACNHDFSKDGPLRIYVHYDRWIDQHAGDAANAKMIKNKDWCNALGPKYQDLYLEKLAAYVDPLCPELKCATMEKYKSCQGAMGGAGQKDQCMLDIEAAAKAAAYAIKKFLTDQSQLAKACTVDGASGTGGLSVAGAQAGSLQAAAGTKSTGGTTASVTTGKTGQVMAQVPTTKQTSGSAANTLAAIKSGKVIAAVPKTAELACPRPMHKYWCEKKYAEWYGSVPVMWGSQKLTLVKCSANLSEDYKNVMNQVKAALALPPNIGLTPAYNDPLLVPLKSKGQYDAVATTKYFKPPSPKAEFAFLMNISGPTSVDGADIPTMFLDLSTGLKQDLKTVPVGTPPKPSPEMGGGPTVSPAAGQAQMATGKLATPALGPGSQLGSMDKTTSTKLPGKASVGAGQMSMKAAAPPAPALPGMGASTPMSGTLPTAGRAGPPAMARTAAPTSGAAPSAPATAMAGQLPPPATPAATATARSLPAVQSPARAPAAQPASPVAPAVAQIARPPQATIAASLPRPQDYSATVKAFNASVTSWKGLPALQPAPRGCDCSTLYSQITALDQRSLGLVKEGEYLGQNLSAGKLDAAAAAKAAQRLTEISKQLDANLAQRKAMAGQYEVQLKNSQQNRLSVPATR